MARADEFPLTVDRVLGWAVAATSAVALIVVLATLPTAGAIAPVDLGALADLTGRLARGDASTYRVEYETRRLGVEGGFAGVVTVVHQPGADLVGSADTLTVRLAERAFTCLQAEDGPQCLERSVASAHVVAPALVGEAVASGRYHLYATGGREIAGERASCFGLDSTVADLIDAFGSSARLCLSNDGIPLSTRIERAGVADERVATEVDRAVTAREVDEMLAPFDEQLSEPAEP